MMSQRRHRIARIAATAVFVAGFLYVMTVINLYKATGEVRFQVFGSPKLGYMVAIMAIAAIVVVLFRVLVRHVRRG
jgi:hypothetical protein